MKLLVEPLADFLGRRSEGNSAALLSPDEQTLFAALSAPKRRREWLAGRVASKLLVISYLEEKEGVVLEPHQVEVLPRPDGSPALRLDLRGVHGPAAVAAAGANLGLSISHRSSLAGDVKDGEEVAGLVAVAVVEHPVAVGIDVELVESRAPVFEQDYFTEEERAWTAGDPFRITVGWSAKEAVFKATRSGLSEDPRSVEVWAGQQDGHEWSPLHVRCHRSERTVQAWFSKQGDYVATLALMGANWNMVSNKFTV